MLGLILESILLIMNAIAILNEKRFLKKYGFDTLSAQPNSPNQMITSRSQIIMMIFAVRSVGKYALIPVNIIAILLEVAS